MASMMMLWIRENLVIVILSNHKWGWKKVSKKKEKERTRKEEVGK